MNVCFSFNGEIFDLTPLSLWNNTNRKVHRKDFFCFYFLFTFSQNYLKPKFVSFTLASHSVLVNIKLLI